MLKELLNEWEKGKKYAQDIFALSMGGHAITPTSPLLDRETTKRLKQILESTFERKGAVIAYPFSFSGEWGDFLESLGFRTIRIDINQFQLQMQRVSHKSVSIAADADNMGNFLRNVDGVITFEPSSLATYSRLWSLVSIGSMLQSVKEGGKIVIIQAFHPERIEQLLKSLQLPHEVHKFSEFHMYVIPRKRSPEVQHVLMLARKILEGRFHELSEDDWKTLERIWQESPKQSFWDHAILTIRDTLRQLFFTPLRKLRLQKHQRL